MQNDFSRTDRMLKKQRSESRGKPEQSETSDFNFVANLDAGNPELNDPATRATPSASGLKPTTGAAKYVVKPTNQNVKAYMQYKEQAKAIWNATQNSVASETKPGGLEPL